MADLMPLHEGDLLHHTTAIGHMLDAMSELNKTARSNPASEAIVKAVDTLTCMIERFEVNEQGGAGRKSETDCLGNRRQPNFAHLQFRS